jgi:predicted ATPase/transcriptional regulator with XRE-family HTH domain/Tfp pilus assembly protein PilF
MRDGPSSPSFAAWLRQLRIARDLTQAALGEHLGYSLALVRAVESGRARPSRGFATRVASYVNLSSDLTDAFALWARDAAPAEQLDRLRPALRRLVEPSTGSAGPRTLPVPLTPLIGRGPEVARVRRRLLRDDVRLVTLTGAPGIGKTRLAIAVAGTAAAAFPDGTVFVPLASLRDPALVLSTIARAIGVAESGGLPLLERLVAMLQGRQVLLLLDNFEHLPQAAPLLSELLGRTTNLTALVTSREPLHLYGEHCWPVPPLALPALRQLPQVAALAATPAVALFVARADAAAPSFACSEANAEAIAAICHRLDGLPLAIELAAARCVPPVTPQRLMERPARQLDELVDGPRDVAARQQTLRGAIAWSYDLLSPPEQAAFRRLAVFSGGWRTEAANAVLSADASDPSPESALTVPVPVVEAQSPKTRHLPPVLRSIVEKSLVQQQVLADGATRFSMLASIGAYAEERLEASGEEQACQRRHADYYVSLAEEAAPALTGPDQVAWLDRLDEEHDNLRAALGWAAACGQASVGLRLAGALWRFWWARGYLSEGRQQLERALAVAEVAEVPKMTPERALVLSGAGVLAHGQGDYAAAQTHHAASLSIARELGDPYAMGRALNNLSLVALMRGDYAAARTLAEEAVQRMGEAGREQDGATALNALAVIALRQGEFAAARRYAERSLVLFEQMGHKQAIAPVLNNLGIAARLGGDHATALTVAKRCLELRRELGDRLGVSGSLINLGLLARDARDFGQAAAHFQESLRMQQELGARLFIAECLEGLATVAAAAGAAERAARLFGAAEALREAISSPLPPYMRPEQERFITAARRALRDAAFSASRQVGRAMPLDQAIAFALNG